MMPLEPLHFSRLKLIARSPLHYAASDYEETAAMERGSATHSMVLGGAPVVQWSKLSDNGNPCPRRGKDYELFVAANPGAIILTGKDYSLARAMADAVRSNALARRVLEGQRELELEWRFGDRPCAGRLDVLGDGFVTELKCTVSSDPTKVMWQSLRMGWFAQLPWYMDGAMQSGIGAPEAAYIVAVEQAAPHAVTVLRLTDRALEQGRRTYRGWLERLLVCEATDEFPPYSQSIVELDVPDNDVALDFGDEAAA
jgi:hypothetical protein